MNNLPKLYQAENKTLLETISLLNFAIGFDKSIASFRDSDLFSFLERVESYDFKLYDDVAYMLDMLDDAFRHISYHMSSQMRRTHKLMSVSMAKELDSKSIEWIAKQNGITITQKLSKGKVLGVKRYNLIDNPENRVLKVVLMRLIEIAEFRPFDEALRSKMMRFMRENLSEVNHKAQIIPNNILLHHKHYAKFYKAYKWLNYLESIMSDFELFKNNILKTKEELKKFIALSQLHKYTNARILPSCLNVKQKEYSIEFDEKCLLEENINQYLNDENDLKNFKNKCLTLIQANKAIKRITPPPNKLTNKNLNANGKIFIDIFRLYPLLYADSKHIAMPLLLKQKIDEKIINANHTKIINVEYNFYTLAECLLSSHNEVFHIFLQDIKEFVGESNLLYYVLPDYINVFDFNEKHRSIRAYFNQAFFINKSILAAANKLFNNELKKDDTLLYFQKNNFGEIFVTPILVRYKNELKDSKSNGLYLEKYPTKKIESSHKNTDKLLQKFLEKCLQNGLKSLNKNNIQYYTDNKIYDIPKLQKETPSNDINEARRLYKKSRALFKANIKIIQDDPKENLTSFRQLIEQKDAGSTLWGERLPKLDIGIDDSIQMKKFNLVGEESELDSHNEIHIKNQFEIPANVESINAPLFLEDEDIEYSMFLESYAMPFKEPMRCKLTLRYSYESRNIYTLIFTPLDENLPQMEAKWHKGKVEPKRKDMTHIYPPYPLVKSIDELRHYPKKDASGENDLFEWVEKSINIKKIQNQLQQLQSKIAATIYCIDTEREFCLARDKQQDEIFCPKNEFINELEWNNINEGSTLYLRKNKNNTGYSGGSISTKLSFLRGTRFPMISIFNGHSLRDGDIPDSFRAAISNFIDFMEDKLKDIDNKELKNEYLFFLSTMHDCAPIEKYLLEINNDSKSNRILAYAIGNARLDWQKDIFTTLFKYSFDKQISILAISLWRSESLVFEIDKAMADKLIIQSMQWIIDKKLFYKNKEGKNFVKSFLVNILEVLLSLLRLRQKGFDILNPSDNGAQNLIDKLLQLSKLIKDKQATLQSYLHLEVKKQDRYKEMPDLIYALISFIKGENSDSIKIIGVNDEA